MWNYQHTENKSLCGVASRFISREQVFVLRDVFERKWRMSSLCSSCNIGMYAAGLHKFYN
jgi:hypothetical protein